MVSFVDAFDLKLSECGIIPRKDTKKSLPYCPLDEINQSTGQSINHSTNQSINQSVNQSVSQNQSVKPANHSNQIDYVYDEDRESSTISINQSISQSTNQLTNQSVNQSVDQIRFSPDVKAIRSRLMNDKRYTVKSINQPVNQSKTVIHYEEEKELIDSDNKSINRSTKQSFHLPEERKSTYYTPSAPFVRGLKPPPFNAAFNQSIDQSTKKIANQKKQLIKQSISQSDRTRSWLLDQIHSVDLSSVAMNSMTGILDFQSINQLKISHNCLAFLDQLPQSINQLIASHNRIQSINQSIFTDRLIELDLSYNQLDSLFENNQPIDQSIDHFPSLTKLDLSFNSFCSLNQSINQLKQFPKLIDLKMTGNPCTVHPYYRSIMIDDFPNVRLIDGLSSEMTEEEKAWRQSLIQIEPVVQEDQSINQSISQSINPAKGSKTKPIKSPVNSKKKASELAAQEINQSIKPVPDPEAQRLLDLAIAEWTFKLDDQMRQSIDGQIVIHCQQFVGLPQSLQTDVAPPVKKDKPKKSPMNADQTNQSLTHSLTQSVNDDSTAVEFDFQHTSVDENGKQVYVKTTISKQVRYRLKAHWIDRLIDSACQSWNQSIDFAFIINEIIQPTVHIRDFMWSSTGLLIELVQNTRTQVNTQKSEQPINATINQPVKGAKKGAVPAVDASSITQEQSSYDVDTVIASTNVSLAELLEPQQAKRNTRVWNIESQWKVNQSTVERATMLSNQSIQSTVATAEENDSVIASVESMTGNPMVPDLTDFESTASLSVTVNFNDSTIQMPVEQSANRLID